MKTRSICQPEHYEALFKEHAKGLRNYLYYKYHNEALADDMTQEAFIKLWQNCAKVVYEEALYFLKRVAVNLSLNTFKHDNVVLKHQQSVSDRSDSQSPQYLLEEKEFEQKVNNAIASLPEKQRVVFLMSRIDGKKYAEIATFLDISVKAVEKRMSAALVILRKKIGNI